MAKKKKTGGRKPVDPSKKVILVGFYTEQGNVETLGGMENARNWAKKFVERQADRAKAFGISSLTL